MPARARSGLAREAARSVGLLAGLAPAKLGAPPDEGDHREACARGEDPVPQRTDRPLEAWQVAKAHAPADGRAVPVERQLAPAALVDDCGAIAD